MTGPFGRPLGDDGYAWLGRRAGAEHDFYLFANGEVWCLASSTSMYCPEWWVPVRGADLDRRLDGGKTVRQLAELRGPVPAGRPEAPYRLVPGPPRPAGLEGDAP